MEDYKLNLEPGQNCYITERIGVAEISCRVIDNRTREQVTLFFYLTTNGVKYCEEKIDAWCKELGFSRCGSCEAEFRFTEANEVFIRCGE